MGRCSLLGVRGSRRASSCRCFFQPAVWGVSRCSENFASSRRSRAPRGCMVANSCRHLRSEQLGFALASAAALGSPALCPAVAVVRGAVGGRSFRGVSGVQLNTPTRLQSLRSVSEIHYSAPARTRALTVPCRRCLEAFTREIGDRVTPRVAPFAGAPRRCDRRRNICRAAARVQSGADGRDPYHSSDSVDDEWQVHFCCLFLTTVRLQ